MKILRGFALAAASVLAVAGFAGCSGGGGIVPPASVSGAPAAGTPEGDVKQRKKAKAHLRIFIPRPHKHTRGRALRPYFVSNGTQGIEVQVYAHGPHNTPLATNTFDVAGGSSLCHAVAGGRSCEVTATAPAGNDDFVVTTYNAPPSSGSFTGAKLLGVGTTTFNVVKGTPNSIGLTLGGVVALGVVTLGKASMPVIDTGSQTATISAKDASGNTIVSDGWFDASGAPVTMNIKSDAPAVAFSPSPNVATFAAPTTKLTYTSSSATSTQVQNGFTATITVTPTNAGSTAGEAALTLAAPSFTQYPISTMSAYPIGIEVGPDNGIWFAEESVNKIGRIATNAAAGTNPTEYGGLPTEGCCGGTSGPTWLANGKDGNIWFTEFCMGQVGSINPTTHAVGTSYLSPDGSASAPFGIANGPDGDLWFAENTSMGKIVKFDPTNVMSTITAYSPHTMTSTPQMITAGPDNNLWFTETGIDAIGKMTTSGTASEYSTGIPMNSIGEGGIMSGPGGVLWFAECNQNGGNAVGNIATGGSPINQYTLTTPAANPLGIVTGPDGAVWFAEQGVDKIARIDPSTHAIIEFTIPAPQSPLTVNSPTGIVLGPDGALWFTEYDGNAIGKLQ